MAHIQEKIDALKAEVEPLTNAVDAMTALLEGVIQDVEDAKDDPVELQAVIDGVRAQKDKLVAATVKHTPADPTVPPVEEPPVVEPPVVEPPVSDSGFKSRRMR